jgi:hypothetical protein
MFHYIALRSIPTVLYCDAGKQQVGIGPGAVWHREPPLLSNGRFTRCFAADGRFEPKCNFNQEGIFQVFGLD